MGETQLANAEDWVDQYGDYLFRFAVRRVYDPEVAQDLVQETFLAALAARHRFVGRSTEKTWLAGILHPFSSAGWSCGLQSTAEEKG